MNKYISDTHSLFWYLRASPRLSASAKAAFDEGVNNLALIYIPSIVLAELHFLNVKSNYPIDFAAEYKKLEAGGQFVFTSFEPQDVLDFDADSAVKEMHDRIVVGTDAKVERRLYYKR